MQVPVGHPAAPVTHEAGAVDPVAAPGVVLDPVIVAQAGAAPLAPPFGSAALGALDADHVVHRPAPAEALRIAMRRRVEHRDLLRFIEQFERSAMEG